MSIEASLECGLGFSYILDATDFASDEIYNISGGASDITLGVMREVGGVTGEVVALLDVCGTYGASVGCTFESAMLNGRRMISERGDFSTNDEILKVAGASVDQNRSTRNSL